MIPIIDIAKLLSRRGVSATVITTPGNEHRARPAIDSANSNSSSTAALPINLIILPFPPSVTDHVPAENRENLTNLVPSDFSHLFVAVAALRPSLHDLLRSQRADFFFTDDVLIWPTDMAAELDIPNLVYTTYGIFPRVIHQRLALNNPFQRFSDENTSVIRIDDIPDPVELTKSEISDNFNYPETVRLMNESIEKSFGVVANTFYDLEPAYCDIFRRGTRAWFVGPVSLSNAADDQVGRANRGTQAHVDTARLMTWLDNQPAGSVVYACFGSLYQLDATQTMREVLIGLEESGHRFVCVVRDLQGTSTGWLPDGFEEKLKGKGWLVKGWAPQLAILGHTAIGAFATHCGWNSLVEGVTAGLPLMTLPLMYEQYLNERLITNVLRVGVKMGKGAKELTSSEVVAAVRRVMSDGEEADGFRRRARELSALAKAAMEAGGSSYEDVGQMVEDLKAHRARKKCG